jgi:DNA-binding NarL/FixJ family response regulator
VSETAPIRILLVDDQPLLRMGFRLILEGEDDLSIVGEASDGAEAVRAVRELTPDVVLMDVRMPVLDGIEATRAITSSGSLGKIIILTTFDLDEYAFAGLQAGASAFLLKDVAPAELISAVRVVASGDAVVAPRITRRLLETYVRDAGAGAATPGVPARPAPGARPARDPLLDDLTEAVVSGTFRNCPSGNFSCLLRHFLESRPVRCRVICVTAQDAPSPARSRVKRPCGPAHSTFRCNRARTIHEGRRFHAR